MKWFLQFLSLGSVVIYTLLVIVDNRIRDGIANNNASSEAQSQTAALECVGPLPFLTDRSVEIGKLHCPPHLQNEALASKPYREGPRQYFDHQPASKDKLAASAIDDDQIGKGPASLPATGD